MPRKVRRKYPWAALPDEELLAAAPQGPQGQVRRHLARGLPRDLYDELEQRGLAVRPHAWLSDEWFSPSDTPGIAFPFYLAHPRLMRLERKMIIDVEGGTRCGMHAHPAPRSRPRDAALLSAASPPPLAAAVRPFVDALSELSIGPNPASRNFVQHLRLWYAQSHPDEDFAETFAVWLTPRSNWRKRYEGWPALKKLQYVDELMAEIADAEADADAADRGRAAAPARTTLGEHYQKKLEHYSVDAPRDLRPRSAAHLLQQPAAPPFAAGGGLHPAPPRRHPAAGFEMDRRISAHARPGARRDDRALPRTEAARGRPPSGSCGPTSPCC